LGSGVKEAKRSRKNLPGRGKREKSVKKKAEGKRGKKKGKRKKKRLKEESQNTEAP